MVRHPQVTEWESRLKAVFDRIDVELEERYGGTYPLHPARARRGTTSNHETDGLFNIGAAFTAGFGSQHGRGYVVSVRMATLADVPDNIRETIREAVVARLEVLLPEAFPERDLRVERDGDIYKIVGDLSVR